VCAGAVFLIWGLAVENQQLNDEISNLYARLDSLQETTALQVSIAEGDMIPDTPVVGPAGETAALDALVARGGVIAFLTTTCPYCKEMLPVWSQIANEYAARGVAFVGVMLDSPAAAAQYAAVEAVDFPLWALADSAAADVDVALVPYTMLVEPGSAVGQVWAGILDNTEIAMVVAALDDELLVTQQTLSGSSERDPDCCPEPALDTGAANGQ
jgi:thiol-disulfide isomerase/thioredoxin